MWFDRHIFLLFSNVLWSFRALLTSYTVDLFIFLHLSKCKNDKNTLFFTCVRSTTSRKKLHNLRYTIDLQSTYTSIKQNF